MGLSGYVGAGASDALEELLAERLVEQQMEDRRKAAEEERKYRDGRAKAQDEDRAYVRGRQEKADSAAEAAAKAAADQRAYQATARANMSELVNDPVQMAAFGVASGEMDPKDAMALTKKPEPPAPKKRAVVVRGLRGEPVSKMVGEDEEVEIYERPERPERPPRTELTPGERVTQTRQLKKEYLQATSQLRELSRQSAQMDAGLAAARNGDMAQGAQAVLVTFQKILDPTSVVRESEYARSASGQSMLNRIEGAFEQLAKGGAGVPVSELEKFANLARVFVDNARRDEATLRQQYEEISQEFGLNPALIIGPERPGGTDTGGGGNNDPLGIRRPQ